MRYRRKPQTVEAYQLTRDVDAIAPEWLIQAINRDKVYIDRALIDGASTVYAVTIYTGMGRLKAKIGDYIIRGPDGQISVCKKADFKNQYERITDGA